MRTQENPPPGEFDIEIGERFRLNVWRSAYNFGTKAAYVGNGHRADATAEYWTAAIRPKIDRWRIAKWHGMRVLSLKRLRISVHWRALAGPLLEQAMDTSWRQHKAAYYALSYSD